MKEAEHRVAFWRGHWKAWAESGTSQQAYCARAGVTYAAFRYWRKRANTEPSATTPAFVPVVVEPPATAVPAPPKGGTGLEIRLPFGRTVVVAPDFDEAVLARVIRALEQIPC